MTRRAAESPDHQGAADPPERQRVGEPPGRQIGLHLVAGTAWVIALLLAFVGMIFQPLGIESPLPSWSGAVALIAPIPLIVAGEFLILFGARAGRIDVLRVLGTPLAAYFVASGLGMMLGHWYAGSIDAYQSTTILMLGAFFALGGAAVIVLVEWIRLRSLRHTSTGGSAGHQEWR